jgi:hypothetical protein
MNASSTIKSDLIAPCGMNCAICMGYLLRKKNKCPGCRGENTNKTASCANCRIINCVNLKENKLKFCYACKKFPCLRMKQLDKRYRTKYSMSMLENLENIKKTGIKKFIINERSRWACPECKGIICVHRPECQTCGQKWR